MRSDQRRYIRALNQRWMLYCGTRLQSIHKLYEEYISGPSVKLLWKELRLI